ncbi:hypothetical protein [Paracoccus sp. T5]|uniref:hypothetical protein n=1 Tax=Paracoccus sp. T5 TaxID=3402161 RepID=UPI003AE56B0D
MSDLDIIGETVVRGVKLEMTRNLAMDSFALAWDGQKVSGRADFDSTANPTQIWSDAIRSLREDPASEPQVGSDMAAEKVN